MNDVDGETRRSREPSVLEEAHPELDTHEGQSPALPLYRFDLPDGGFVRVDRPLPFLCLYRAPLQRADPGTAELLSAESIYVCVAGTPRGWTEGLREVRDLVELGAEKFGAFALLEVWAGADVAPSASGQDEFRVVLVSDGQPASEDVVQALTQALSGSTVLGHAITVEVVRREQAGLFAPDAAVPLEEARAMNCALIGMEVQPIFRDPETGEVYPTVLRAVRRVLSKCLRRGLFQLARHHMRRVPTNYRALGPRSLGSAVWEADARLARVADRFDFLLAMSPINADEAWGAFERSDFEKAPALRYRPLRFDPPLLKRELFSIPIERIDDPALASILREKQYELEQQLTILAERGTPRALLTSQNLYGTVDGTLERHANAILERVHNRHTGDESSAPLPLEGSLTRIRRELDAYRQQWEGFQGNVMVSDTVLAGVMVSRGTLLLSSSFSPTAERLDALIQHEIGIHLLTYFNATRQPFHLLRCGCAGYDEMQEGMAVMAEYLVGGLTAHRLRTLAARVAAAKAIESGADFVETFRMLCRYGFFARSAFQVAMRVFRGGGLTKDLVYLRGLLRLIERIQNGKDLEGIFLGKFDFRHLPVWQELSSRDVLAPAPLKPRFLDRPEAQERLAEIRGRAPLHHLVQAA